MKRIDIFKTSCLALALAFSLDLQAWGSKGHKIIAAIAERHLSASVKDSIKKYLGSMSLAEASVWMDEVRSDHHFDYLKQWHYINVPEGKEYEQTKGNNIANHIIKAFNGLKDRGDLEKTAFNLKVLCHLMGDLYQPLHCGYAEDKGGNMVKVKFKGRQSNLHKVWDSELIEALQTEPVKLGGVITAHPFTDISEFVGSRVKDSRRLLPLVYSFQDGVIEQGYINKVKSTLEGQLINAGEDLAKILSNLFEK